MFGGFINIMNKYKSAVGGLSNVVSADMLESKFSRFFEGYKRNYYKRQINYVK